MHIGILIGRKRISQMCTNNRSLNVESEEGIETTASFNIKELLSQSYWITKEPKGKISWKGFL